MPTIRGELVPAGSRVLEVGYGDGLLTCYLCREALRPRQADNCFIVSIIARHPG